MRNHQKLKALVTALSAGAALAGALATQPEAQAATARTGVWSQPVDRGGTVPSAPIVSYDVGSGHHEFVYVGANKRIYMYDGAKHRSVGGSVPGRLGSAVNSAFYRGDDGALYLAGMIGTYTWRDEKIWRHQSWGGQVSGDPGGVPGNAFYRGMDGQMYHAGSEGHRPLGFRVNGPITAGSWGNGEFHVFFTNDRVLQHAWNTPEGWKSETLGGEVPGRVAVAHYGRSVGPGGRGFQLFYRGTNRALYRLRFDGKVWSGHERLGGSLPSDPVAASSGRFDWVPNADRVEVFYRGGNGQLYQLTCRAQCSTHERRGGYMQTDPAVAITRNEGHGDKTYRITVAYGGRGGRLFTQAYKES